MISTSKLTRHCFVLLAILFGLFGSYRASASHFAAVDMYVDYIGNGPSQLKYRVTLIVYKACEPNNANLSTQENVTVSSSCVPGTVNLPMFAVGGLDTLDQLCPNFAPVNACRVPGSVWPAFVRQKYQDTIIVPQACSDWTFVWSNSARNGGIVNLCSPASQGIRVTVVLNNQLRYNNNSPRLAVDPIPYFCVNQPTLFFNGPLDPDQDSINMVNVMPMGCAAGCPNNGPGCGSLTEIPYTGTYNLTNPIASSNGYAVDPQSGIASFTPTIGNGAKFVLAFRVYEYDKATKTQMGFVTRDVQVSVLNCNSGPPTIDRTPQNPIGGTIDTSSGNVMIACPGNALSFDVHSTSQTLSNAVYMTADLGGLTTANFTVTGQGQGSPVGHFTWTPTTNDIGVHQIVIQAKDSTCDNNQPIVFRSYLTLLIRVVAGVNAGPDLFGYCALNGDPIQLGATGAPNIVYHWYNANTGDSVGITTAHSQNPLVVTSVTTPYVVYSNDLPPGCKNKDTVIVNVDGSNSISVTPTNPYVFCRPGYLQLGSTATGPKPLQNMACGTANPVTCTTPDSVNVGTSASTDATTSPFFGQSFTSRVQYIIRRSELLGSGLKPGTLKSLAFTVQNTSAASSGTYSNFKISIGCTTKDQFVNATDFVSGLTQVYTNAAQTIVNTPYNTPLQNEFVFTTPYSWDTTMNIVVEVCYSGASGATDYVFATGTTYGACIRRYSTSGDACTSASGTTVGPFNFRPNIKFKYCTAPEADFVYKWVPGTFLSDSTAQNPIAYIPKSTKYFVYTRGRNGCLVRDSLDIYVPVHDFTVSPKDTAICENEKALLHAISKKTTNTYKWYEVNAGGGFDPAATLDNDITPNPIAQPTTPGDYKYAVVVTDSVSCSDTLFIKVKLKQLPAVKILNKDTMIKYGQSVQLLVSGAYLYTWSPVGTLTDPNVVNPIATPTEPTRYHVVGIANNGCRNEDSVIVTIDYRDHLFVPTAFTPNGDGKNDDFRIVNLSFQKVLEFRVFNRWGQEIFNTLDGKKGWDGKWKGVDQDMGTYNYIIRVGYPDGLIETYKGDVTLVR